MSYSSAEVKSGILITVSGMLLLGLTFMVGNYLGGDTYTWKIQFGYICGLQNNAPVYYAGHEVGKVESIEILSGQEHPILVSIRVSQEVRLREDSTATIDTLGLMGEKFIELSPGSRDAKFLPPESLILGEDPLSMHSMIGKVNLLAERMDELTLYLNPLVRRLDGFLEGHEEEIAKMIANLHQTSQNVRDMTHDLKFHPWRLVRKG